MKRFLVNISSALFILLLSFSYIFAADNMGYYDISGNLVCCTRSEQVRNNVINQMTCADCADSAVANKSTGTNETTGLGLGGYSVGIVPTGKGSGFVTYGDTPDSSFPYPSAMRGVIILLTPSASATVTAAAEAGSTVTWSGDCSSTGGTPTDAICFIGNIDADKAITATFDCSNDGIMIKESTTYYPSVQEAYNSAADGQSILLHRDSGTLVYVLGTGLTLDRDIIVGLSGGYLCDYSVNPFRTSVLGFLNIKKGAVTVDNLTLR